MGKSACIDCCESLRRFTAAGVAIMPGAMVVIQAALPYQLDRGGRRHLRLRRRVCEGTGEIGGRRHEHLGRSSSAIRDAAML
jgi:hypothetical protein